MTSQVMRHRLSILIRRKIEQFEDFEVTMSWVAYENQIQE